MDPVKLLKKLQSPDFRIHIDGWIELDSKKLNCDVETFESIDLLIDEDLAEHNVDGLLVLTEEGKATLTDKSKLSRVGEIAESEEDEDSDIEVEEDYDDVPDPDEFLDADGNNDE